MVLPFDSELDHTSEKFIRMKCTMCGFEEDMPSWCYDEVAEMMLLDNNPDAPHIHCTRCDRPTFYRKP